MSQLQNFRSAFNGFNREDVVNYIAYINNHFNAQIGQLQSQLQCANQEILSLRDTAAQSGQLQDALEDSNNRISVLEGENSSLQQQLAHALESNAQLQEAWNSANGRVAELESQNSDLQQQLDQALNAEKPQNQEELEAYRRAERVERIANERVTQLYAQANGALGDATAKVDDVSSRLSNITDQVIAQLTQLQSAVITGKETLRDAAAAMFAVQPITPEE